MLEPGGAEGPGGRRAASPASQRLPPSAATILPHRHAIDLRGRALPPGAAAAARRGTRCRQLVGKAEERVALAVVLRHQRQVTRVNLLGGGGGGERQEHGAALIAWRGRMPMRVCIASRECACVCPQGGLQGRSPQLLRRRHRHSFRPPRAPSRQQGQGRGAGSG